MATTAKIARDEKLAIAKAAKDAQAAVPASEQMLPVRTAAGVSEEVQTVPDLFPQTSPGGGSAGRGQGVMVRGASRRTME
jgi:membrane protein involved in colicin uptake